MGVMPPALQSRPATDASRAQPMFRPAVTAGRAAAGDFFLRPMLLIRLQEVLAAVVTGSVRSSLMADSMSRAGHSADLLRLFPGRRAF